MTTAKYTEDSITGFTRDLEKIQSRPNMYIGPTDSSGIYTITREPADNAVDEARAGRNSLVEIIIGKDGYFWVIDAGVGIPVGMHKKMKISTLTHVLTNLQSSGKMSGDAYKHSIGTHGVGIKATNALSKEFDVWTFRKDSGGWHHTRFEHGKEVSKVKKLKSGPRTPTGSPKLGTVIRFKPDEKFFKKHRIEPKQLALWCQMTAYMNSGLSVKLTVGSKSKTWKFKDGIKDYISNRVEKTGANPFSKKYIFVNTEKIEMALVFTDLEGSSMEFFTNTVRNVDGGVHADDLYKALFDSLKPHMKIKEKTKTKKKSKKSDGPKYPFTPTDIQDGLMGLLNYKINAPLFSGQTKEKLVDDRVKGACYEDVKKHLEKFWKENSTLAKQLIQRATDLRSKTADFLKDKKLLKNVGASKKAISSKLAGVVGRTPVEERELFIVEGDSAGGGCKRARDKSFQAVYPMKGKPLNVMEAQKEKINNNAEVTGLLAAIGADQIVKGKPIVLYGKIIIMADPDVDGKHITCLDFATLWKYRPDLFRDGYIYVVKSPLFIGKKSGKTYFGDTKEQIYDKYGSKNIDCTYIKGFGEVNEEDLSIFLDPKQRVLYKVGPPTKSGAFELLMGKKPAYRKNLLGVT